MTDDPITELIAESIDDERLYHAQFSVDNAPGGLDPSADTLEAELRTEAERLEQTVGCVTTVVRTERGRVGPKDYYNLTLFAILPRHTDTELFDRVVDEARYRALDRAHEKDGSDR
jgi:hypothetical protein